MIKKLFYIVFVLLLIPSCNEYQKLLRSEDIKIKYQKAEYYFENEGFRRASGLFEQILPKYRGKPQAERITFFYAKSLLEIKNYVLAAYQFESFIKAYPISQKVEEAAYLEAYHPRYGDQPILLIERNTFGYQASWVQD